MRYLDTGSEDPGQTLGRWLETNCKDDISSFKAQFGYFSFAAVRPFVKVFRSLSEREATVDFVLGSNSSSLRRTDLESLVEAVAGPKSTITVVTFQNAEFHPKTAHICSNDGAKEAIVTSANLTVRGASRNVEAGISLSTRDGDDPRVLGEIEGAIDRWKSSSSTGVYRVSSQADVRALKRDKIIGEQLIDSFADKTGTQSGGNQLRGSRSPLWRPFIERVKKIKLSMPEGIRTIEVPQLQTTVSPRIWYRKMDKTAAQWQENENTSLTGNLRLTQAGFDIDAKNYFVNEFFSNALWEDVMKEGKLYKVAYIIFDVTIGSIYLGRKILRVDYAAHREAAQSNHTTVLKWGPELGLILRKDDYRDMWVILERLESGDFRLRVQKSKP